ncbi:hypothetical protein BDZ97DRAFT_1634579, partial [Flammula alnicola]
SKLATTNWPAAVGGWIQRARSATWRPRITDVLQYAMDFMHWWIALQPKWRVSVDGKILVEEVGGDWDVLRKSGPNGLVVVMAALFYW